MFCKNCGAEILPNAAFCTNCGTAIETGVAQAAPTQNNVNMPNGAVAQNGGGTQTAYYGAQTAYNALNAGAATVSTPEKTAAYQKLSQMENTAAIVWLIIGIIQLITTIGFIVGIWNIVVSIKRFKYAKSLTENQPPVYNTYANSQTTLIIFGVLNLFLGAVIGVAGVGYDFYIRSYVMKNKELYE